MAGYERQVLLPVLVTALDLSLPVTLNLSINYSICADICIPLEAVLQLEIPPVPLASAPGPDPRGARPGAEAAGTGRLLSAQLHCRRRHSVNGRPALVIKTAFEENATGLELFVEAPEGLSLPSLSLQPPSSRGRSHYVMFFDTQAAVDALLGKTLTLTTVSNQGSCESTWRVK